MVGLVDGAKPVLAKLVQEAVGEWLLLGYRRLVNDIPTFLELLRMEFAVGC